MTYNNRRQISAFITYCLKASLKFELQLNIYDRLYKIPESHVTKCENSLIATNIFVKFDLYHVAVNLCLNIIFVLIFPVYQMHITLF